MVTIIEILKFISEKEKYCVLFNGKNYKKINIDIEKIKSSNTSDLIKILSSELDVEFDIFVSKKIILISKKFTNIENNLPNVTYGEVMVSVLNICKLYEKYFPTLKKEYNTNMTLNFARAISEDQMQLLKAQELRVSKLSSVQMRLLWDLVVQMYLQRLAINFDRDLYDLMKKIYEEGMLVVEGIDSVDPFKYGLVIENKNIIKIKIPKTAIGVFKNGKNDVVYNDISSDESLIIKINEMQKGNIKYKIEDILKEKQYLILGEKFANIDDLISVIRAREKWKFSFKDKIPTLSQDVSIPSSFDLSSINDVAINLLPKAFLDYLKINSTISKDDIRQRINIDMYNTVSIFINNYLTKYIVLNKINKFQELSPTAKTLVALKLIQDRCDTLCNVTSHTPAYISFFQDAVIGGGWRTENGKQVFDLTIAAVDSAKQRGDRLSLTVGAKPIPRKNLR